MRLAANTPRLPLERRESGPQDVRIDLFTTAFVIRTSTGSGTSGEERCFNGPGARDHRHSVGAEV
jgi:hypothetical protein